MFNIIILQGVKKSTKRALIMILSKRHLKDVLVLKETDGMFVTYIAFKKVAADSLAYMYQRNINGTIYGQLGSERRFPRANQERAYRYIKEAYPETMYNNVKKSKGTLLKIEKQCLQQCS
jgi:hypothetical protein